jgi:hypothetical protein
MEGKIMSGECDIDRMVAEATEKFYNMAMLELYNSEYERVDEAIREIVKDVVAKTARR